MKISRYAMAKGAVVATIGSLSVAAIADPSYQIHDLGVVGSNDTASQGIRISDNGIATGRSVHSGGNQAFTWTLGGGTVGLANPTSPARAYAVGNGVNTLGTVVGTGSTTVFGSSPLPFIWKNGIATQLGLPTGKTAGNAWDVNDHDVAVGSADGGINQRGVIYQNGTGTIITATTANGSFFNQAYGINNNGLVVGSGWDPNNAAITVGLVYDIKTGQTKSVGSLTSEGHNSAIAFDVSETGYVVGASSLNGGSGSLPFIWSDALGMTEIALPTGTTTGIARGVNSAGWTVGVASSAFAVPFLNDGTKTYRIGDLIAPGSGWDLLTNTSSSALGISDNGYIVGTGVLNGKIHAYVLTPVPEPATMFGLATGVLALVSRRRKAK